MPPGHGHIPHGLHLLFWLAWLIYWLVSARNVKRTARSETAAQRMAYVLPILLALLLSLFFFHTRGTALAGVITHHPVAIYWLGTAVLAAGLLFSVWARRTLGRNWSGKVTVKEDHQFG